MSPAEYPRDFTAFRIEIDGSWSAQEMAVFLRDLARLYEIRSAVELDPDSRSFPGRLDPFGRWWPRFAWSRWRDDEAWRLEVIRIKHESPGFVDLAGLGKVVEEIRLFVEKLIDLPATRRREKLENDAAKIENVRNFIRLLGEARELGLDEDDMRRLLYEIDGTQERLMRLVERGNITAIGPAPMPGEEPPSQAGPA